MQTATHSNHTALLVCACIATLACGPQPGTISTEHGATPSSARKIKPDPELLSTPHVKKKTRLAIGDETKVVKDTMKYSTATYSHLWLDLNDREREKWINTPGFGEGNKFDYYVEECLKAKRILPVAFGTRVAVVDLKPSGDREYYFTYFKVRVLDGPNANAVGWLSYFGLEYPPGRNPLRD